MEVTLKVKFGSNNPRIESFGNNRYLVYISSSQGDVEQNEEIVALLSKQFGVPAARIELKRDNGGDKLFFIG